MIELKNISITYQKPLIKSCDLSFPDKSVTLIQGPSGTGKTSLLYRIGLIQKMKTLPIISMVNKSQQAVKKKLYGN